MIEKLKKAFYNWESMVVVALAVSEDGVLDGYDGEDNQIEPEDIKTYTDIIGIS
jgi:hypothetical protein